MAFHTTRAPGMFGLYFRKGPVETFEDAKASDGERRILDIEPQSLHQRTPFFVGSKKMVEKAESFKLVSGFAVPVAS